MSQGAGNDINNGYMLHCLTSITKMPENEVTSFVFDSDGRMNCQNNSNGTYTEYE